MLLIVLVPRLASASPPAADSQPVITPGREEEILALFAPHAVGAELVPGWTLHSFSIEVSTISVWVAGPEDTYANLALDHPDNARVWTRASTWRKVETETRSLLAFARPVDMQEALARHLAVGAFLDLVRASQFSLPLF